MSILKGTFDDLWTDLVPVAKARGVLDGDLARVRSRVKAMMVTAGWADPDGSVGFSNDADAATALQAARQEIWTVAGAVSAGRKAEKLQAGMAPTKSQVLSATTAQTASLQSQTNTVNAASFSPQMGKVGDRCPRCSGSMEPVGLANSKGALYCTKDRVVIPLSPDNSVRY